MIRRLCVALILFSGTAFAQSQALTAYLKSANIDAASLAQVPPGTRDIRQLQNLLPHINSNAFVEYVKIKSNAAGLTSLLDSLDAARLNKLIGGGTGSGGTTSLVSSVAVPSVIGLGVEYGNILQETENAVTTLRGNALGLARLAMGDAQFPYCPEVDQANCTSATRYLRRFSGSVSWENIKPDATTVSASPLPANLLGRDFRMQSWGARFDLTGTNNLDDPKYLNGWAQAVDKLRMSPSSAALSKAVSDLFTTVVRSEVYTRWMAETITVLQKADGRKDLERVLGTRLDLLISSMSATDPDFASKVANLSRAYSSYFDVRDGMIRDLQTHKMSLEYLNQHSQDQPSTSAFRFIFSHQPSSSDAVVTINAALDFYNSPPSGSSAGHLRDVQISGQIDRHIREFPRLGFVTATFAGYYQWMRQDALIAFGSGNNVPGTTITLPGGAASLLGTKGQIVIFQGKLSIPVGNSLKVPISVTGANRTELINEKDVRGQIGLTLDMDSLFH